MSNGKDLRKAQKAIKAGKPVVNPYKYDIDYMSKMGYRDDSPYNQNPYNDIYTPNGMIDMSQTGIPLYANGQYLPPYSGMHDLGTSNVREVPANQFPIAQKGLGFKMERKVDDWLGYPQEFGQKAAAYKGNQIDNVRHAAAAYKTAKALSDKVSPYIGEGLGNIAGFIGSNVLGLGHELFGENNTGREHMEDLYNNLIGAKQIFAGMSPQATAEYIRQLSSKGKLAFGDKRYGGDPSLPNITGHYQGGGWLDAYQDGGLRAASTTGASAVSTKAPQVALNNTDNYKTGIQYIQEKWKNRDPSDNWNLLMPDKYGSYVDSGIDPFALMLAAPQGAIKTAKAAGKYLTEETPLKNAKTVNDKIADIKNKVTDSRISTINDINKLKSERPRNFTENPNKFLSGEWKNTNQNFVNQNPLDANDFNGLREVPIDPKYLDNFLLNNKPSEGFPSNKYGGQKKLKRTTSKNIQSSINDLMLRNETLFGPPGKVRYKPKLKYGQGGWLDQFDK